MRLLIGIATYNRIKKLERCLQSIKQSTHKDFSIVVVADNQDIETAEFIGTKHFPEVDILVQEKQSFVVGAWNRVVHRGMSEGGNQNWQAFLGLCDDVELKPDTLELAIRSLKNNFPNLDGVIGLHQECPKQLDYTFKWYGQTLMGRTFIERYKDAAYQVCCPDYKHFYQDEEMYTYALSLKKFVKCPEASLYHYHPSFLPEEEDETHRIVRHFKTSPRERDSETFRTRKQKDYLWGRDFKLIGSV